jgi:RimJ/RimL family protein N-acetyltransferase
LLQARSIWTKIREDMSCGIQFVRKRDFYEELRVCEFHLNVPAFDPTPYTRRNTLLATQGIAIKTLQELEVDPERYQKLYDLINETRSDLPATEHWTQPGYEHFLQETLNRTPACYFVALHQNRYVGVSYLTPHKEINSCFQGFTGVKRMYRRKGIALALKLRAIAYAKEHTYLTIKTSIDASNSASLAVNQHLGFVKQPEWIVFTKDFPAVASVPSSHARCDV